MKHPLPFSLLPVLRLAIAACAAASVGTSAVADDPVLWDLSRDDIPPALRSGAIEIGDGVVKLQDGNFGYWIVSWHEFFPQANPDDWEAWYWAGVGLLEAGDKKQARAALEHAWSVRD